MGGAAQIVGGTSSHCLRLTPCFMGRPKADPKDSKTKLKILGPPLRRTKRENPNHINIILNIRDLLVHF